MAVKRLDAGSVWQRVCDDEQISPAGFGVGSIVNDAICDIVDRPFRNLSCRRNFRSNLRHGDRFHQNLEHCTSYRLCLLPALRIHSMK